MESVQILAYIPANDDHDHSASDEEDAAADMMTIMMQLLVQVTIRLLCRFADVPST